jgi:hypothetical protein
VNELLARAGAFFVAPSAVAPARPVASAAGCAGVVSGRSDLPAVAGAVAAALRRRARTATAVVAVVGGAPVRRPSTPAAAAAAKRLARRDIAAVPAGGLCAVALPADPQDAVREAWRVIAAAGVPVVIGVDRRDEALDRLLAELDLIVLAPPAGADPALTDLALASLVRVGPPVETIGVATGALARCFAGLGLRPADLGFAGAGAVGIAGA